MELLQLRYFCDAAECENFSLVAKKYSVPTSAVSQSIRRLEKELSCELFDRSANRASLNDRGAEFLQKVKAAIELIDGAVAEVLREESACIDICINTNRRIVMQAVEKFKRQYPDIEIKAKVFADPTDSEFDMIITYDDERLNGYNRRKLLSEKIALAVPRQNPLYGVENLDISQLKAQPFITTTETGSLYPLAEGICAEYGFKPKIAVQSDDPFYVRKCVEYGLGVTLVPLFSWQGQVSDNIRLIPIEGHIRDTFIYTNNKKKPSVYTERFIDMLVDECKGC